jgi:hypothetical protein
MRPTHSSRPFWESGAATPAGQVSGAIGSANGTSRTQESERFVLPATRKSVGGVTLCKGTIPSIAKGLTWDGILEMSALKTRLFMCERLLFLLVHYENALRGEKW